MLSKTVKIISLFIFLEGGFQKRGSFRSELCKQGSSNFLGQNWNNFSIK